jgi:hypothetical protein
MPAIFIITQRNWFSQKTFAKICMFVALEPELNAKFEFSGEHVDDAAAESAVADHLAAERVEHGQAAVAATGAEGARQRRRRDHHQLDGGARRGDDGRVGAARACRRQRRLRRRGQRAAAAPRGGHAATSAGASGS